MKVFISYAREDFQMAMKIYSSLMESGIDAWIDNKNLLPGQRWKEVIYREIEKCSYFLALISSSSISKTGYVQKELKIALDILDKYPPENVFIIPVRLDESEVYDLKLKELNWIDLFESYNEGIYKILMTIRSLKNDLKFSNNDILKSKKCHSKEINIDNRSNGIFFGRNNNINITGDIVGGDKTK